MAVRTMSEMELEEIRDFEEQIASSMRKYKRRLKRNRSVGYENRETHVNKISRPKFNDIDEQYEAYLRTGSYDYDSAEFTF